MTRSASRVLLGLVLALSACVDFVEVAPPEPGGQVALHRIDASRAEVTVIHRDVPGPIRVAAAGALLSGTAADGGGWHHVGVVRIDSLAGAVQIAIDAGDGFGAAEIVIPLLTRDGPVLWREDGGLELPVAIDLGEDLEWTVGWSLRLVDAEGQPLLRLESRGPIPIPVVIPGALIPGVPATARLHLTGWAERRTGPYPLLVVTADVAEMNIPERP